MVALWIRETILAAPSCGGRILIMWIVVCGPMNYLFAQATASFTGQRSFVVGLTPVVGPNGGVGGIDVDAEGVIARAEQSEVLDGARRDAIEGAVGSVHAASAIRKVSLPRLEEAIRSHTSDLADGDDVGLPSEMLLLAGLTRIEYLFIYPDQREVVIAGPAEDWTLNAGEVVGVNSGSPTLRLDDLLEAFQAQQAAVEGHGILCSIDPVVENMAQVQRLLSRSSRLSERLLRQVELQLGDQQVTVGGVRPESHFARVLVASDYLMKRLAMGLEPSPVPNSKSFIELLSRARGAAGVTAPRWWLAPKYDQVKQSADGLTWQLSGQGLQALSEHGYLNAKGELVNAGRPTPLAAKWADQFTDDYPQLATKIHAFGQLRGCIDFAVIAAILAKFDLLQRAECPLLMLTDPMKISGNAFAVPRRIPSIAKAARIPRGWLVSVSGGVDVDTKSVLDSAVSDPGLSRAHSRSLPDEQAQRWWWD